MDSLVKVYRKSANIIEREIENEMVIILSISGVVDFENDSLFIFNEVAKEFWQKIDGRRKVSDIIAELENIYDSGNNDLISDALELLEILIKKKLIIE